MKTISKHPVQSWVTFNMTFFFVRENNSKILKIKFEFINKRCTSICWYRHMYIFCILVCCNTFISSYFIINESSSCSSNVTRCANTSIIRKFSLIDIYFNYTQILAVNDFFFFNNCLEYYSFFFLRFGFFLLFFDLIEKIFFFFEQSIVIMSGMDQSIDVLYLYS